LISQVFQGRAASPSFFVREAGLLIDFNKFPHNDGKRIRERIKAASGISSLEENLWRIAYGAIRGTDLEDRINVDFIEGKRKK
jgi:hypothetical protein